MARRSPQRAGAGPPSWSVTVHGERGALRHGYQHAASLAGWVLEHTGAWYRVTATVSDRHAYWSRQTPLDLILETSRSAFRWPDVSPPTTDGTTVWLFHSPPTKE